MRNHDQFYLKPFQIDSKNGANKFDIVCKLAACKEGSWTNQNSVCRLGNKCSTRYDPLSISQVGRRRRAATNDVMEEDSQQVGI